jgi:integrase
MHGRRESFPLRTGNKQAAAAKAARIYGDVNVLGWEAALAKHKPGTAKAAAVATVGDLIEAATRLSSARPESLDAYAKALRRITAAVIGLDDGRKYDFKRGSPEWRQKVDAVTLDKLTPARVLAWKNAFLKAAKSPDERNRAVITMNSLIRNSKALLSKKVLPFLHNEIKLPAELWFQGVTNEKEPSLRYKSKVDATAIIAAARVELADAQPEAFKLLLLTLVCGLRRSEADSLLWSQIDFEKGVVSIEDNEFRRLKSKDSAGEIGLDAEIVAMLRRYQARATGAFVLETPKLTRVAFTKRKSRGYRCEATHQFLLDWLRANGVQGLRPIHTLRKEIGSIIASRDGIFKASRYLRHSDIRITSRLYADAKTPVCAGLGELFTVQSTNAVQPSSRKQSQPYRAEQSRKRR